MLPVICPQCGGRMELDETRSIISFTCPYCAVSLSPVWEGKALLLRMAPAACSAPLSQGTSQQARELLQQAEKQKDPKKRFRLLSQALEIAPEDFSVHEALLYHGRLHEPLCGKGIDYSIFKCHLLNIFAAPGAYSPQVRLGKLEELLRSPQLLKTMELSGNPEAFFAGYLRRLTKEYMDLFILGATQNRQTLFGVRRSEDSKAFLCAQTIKTMLQEIGSCGEMDEKSRAQLLSAVRESFLAFFPTHESLLS